MIVTISPGLYVVTSILVFLAQAVALKVTFRAFKTSGASWKHAMKLSAVLLAIDLASTFIEQGISDQLVYSFVWFLGLIVSMSVFVWVLRLYLPSTSTKRAIGIYFARFIVMTALLVPFWITKMYIVDSFVVSGSAMAPTYQNESLLLVNKTSKSFERGDVVTFRWPLDESKYFIKRVIGLPNEKLEFSDGSVFVNGEKLDEPYIHGQATYASTSTILGPDEYFMMGDNRASSSDSRIWGPVKESLIAGKVFLRLK